MPQRSTDEPGATAALSAHVDFLTQPALRGRFAGSWESAHVRKYLSHRLAQYGCVPWADNPSFELSVGLGKNIIAVLPGSDPQLAGEMVLVSAHYDHLKPKLFSYYPGACDNAAAAAVLLETARAVSQMEQRPRRSICFAFFDAEETMCLGSFAFTCRRDYEDSKIVAVLNMDLLGRSLLDVIDSSLIVTGAEHYAGLHDQIASACSQENLTFIPLETDLIGPVGDHVAFTSSQRPVLFFTSGINKDYHQPADTSDKLNYQTLRRQGAVVQRTLLKLADDDGPLLTRRAAPVRIEPFLYLLNQFKQNSPALKLDPNDLAQLDALIRRTEQADPHALSKASRLNLQRESLGKLLKLLKNYDKTLSECSDAFLQVSALFAMHPQALTETYRRTVSHYSDHKPSFFKRNEFAYHSNLPLTADDWDIVKTRDGEFFFAAVNSQITLQNEIHFLSRVEYAFALNHKLTACKGSLDRILRYVFAGNSPNGLALEKHEEAYVIGRADISENGGLSPEDLAARKQQLWPQVRAVLQRKFPDEAAALDLRPYDDPNTFAADPNASSRSIFIMAHASDAAKKDAHKSSVDYSVALLGDASKHVEQRVSALNYLAYIASQQSLKAIADVVDDPSPYTSRPRLIDDSQFPLREHPYVSRALFTREKRQLELKDKTLGPIALQALKDTTKQDFGTDKKAWHKWIEKNIRPGH